MTDHAYIQVQYVNPRNGNRPPSIKDSQGVTYTVSDPAIGMFQQGMQGDIGFYTNARGYPVAVEWEGQELPKGPAQRQAPPQQQRPAPPPSPPNWQFPSNTPQGTPPKQALSSTGDIPPILSNVLAHAIAAGAKPHQLPEWANWTREAIKTFQNGPNPVLDDSGLDDGNWEPDPGPSRLS